jgi:hypothetical protein
MNDTDDAEQFAAALADHDRRLRASRKASRRPIA